MSYFDGAVLATQLVLLGHVAVAMLLGGAIGLERETVQKAAGLRTHMLVAGVAALLTGLGPVIVAASDAGIVALRADPIRILEAVITGVSFLGAGTIIRGQHGGVHGLTTAGSILFSAGIGITVGLSQWLVAVGIVLFVVITLRGVRHIEGRWISGAAGDGSS